MKKFLWNVKGSRDLRNDFYFLLGFKFISNRIIFDRKIHIIFKIFNLVVPKCHNIFKCYSVYFNNKSAFFENSIDFLRRKVEWRVSDEYKFICICVCIHLYHVIISFWCPQSNNTITASNRWITVKIILSFCLYHNTNFKYNTHFLIKNVNFLKLIRQKKSITEALWLLHKKKQNCLFK